MYVSIRKFVLKKLSKERDLSAHNWRGHRQLGFGWGSIRLSDLITWPQLCFGSIPDPHNLASWGFTAAAILSLKSPSLALPAVVREHLLWQVAGMQSRQQERENAFLRSPSPWPFKSQCTELHQRSVYCWVSSVAKEVESSCWLKPVTPVPSAKDSVRAPKQNGIGCRKRWISKEKSEIVGRKEGGNFRQARVCWA